MRRISLESQRRSTLAVGSLMTLYVGSVLTCNTYRYDIKYRFNATETDMLTLSTLNSLGVWLGLPCCQLVMNIISPVYIMNMSLLCSVLALGNCILYLASHYFLDFFQQQFWLIIACNTICAFLSGISVLVSLSMTLKNFPARNHARIIGFLGGLYWLIPGMFSAIYGMAFAPSKNIDGYLFIRALIVFVINILALIFMKEIPYDNLYSKLNIPNDCSLQSGSDESTKLALEDSARMHPTANYDWMKPEIMTGITEMESLSETDVLSISLWFIIDAFLSVAYIFLIGVILDTYGLQDYFTVLTLTVPLVAGVITMCFTSDKYLPNHPKTTLPLMTISAFIQIIIINIIIHFVNSATLIIFLLSISTLLFLFTRVILCDSLWVDYIPATYILVVLILLYIIRAIVAILAWLVFPDELYGFHSRF